MREAQPRHTVNADLAFRHHFAFDPDSTSYTLDYVDSNGDRYTQELAEYDFTETDIPTLRHSSLQYFPAHTGYRHESDYFLGQVVCDNPIFGMERSNRLPRIRQLLTQRLQDCVPNHTIRHQEGYIRITNDSDPSIVADIYLEGLENNAQLQFELLVPSPHTIDEEERYDDLCFTSELWVIIHDFCANLSLELDASARTLGSRLLFSSASPAQTLQIGYELAVDACRFGIELLNQAVQLDGIKLSSEINIRQFDETFIELPDDVLVSVIRLALTLAHDRREKTLTPDLLILSLRAERDFTALDDSLDAAMSKD